MVAARSTLSSASGGVAVEARFKRVFREGSKTRRNARWRPPEGSRTYDPLVFKCTALFSRFAWSF